MRFYVVDTNIFIVVLGGTKNNPPVNHCHLGFFRCLIDDKNCRIVIDKHIKSEYEKHCIPQKGTSHYLITELYKRGKFIQVPIRQLPPAIRKRIREDLHQEDVHFVKAAYSTEDKHLVSEDSDYNNDLIRKLKKELGVVVTSAHGAWNCDCCQNKKKPAK